MPVWLPVDAAIHFSAMNQPRYKGTVKKVINNLPKYNAMSTEETG